MKSVDCSTGIHDYCNRCDCECHDLGELTLEELKILDTWLNYQALPYDNYELHRIVKKIGQIVAQK